MAGKKKSEIVRKAETRQKLNKMGAVTDVDIAAEAALKSEAEARKELKEMEEVQSTPDKPMPERWGYQRLTIATPGTIAPDPFYIPETVELTTGGRRRIATHRWIRGQLHVLTSDGQRKFRWCSRRKIPIHKRYGFRFASYRELFDNTGLFESGPGDTVWNGDAVLMSISLDGWERMRQQTEELRKWLDGSFGNEFFQKAQNAGVPSFQEDPDRGVREMMT